MYQISDDTLLANAFAHRGGVRVIAPFRYDVAPEEVHGLVIWRSVEMLRSSDARGDWGHRRVLGQVLYGCSEDV